MAYLFGAESADEAWQLAATKFRAGVARPHKGSRSGPTIELLHVTFSIANPGERWVLSRTPALNPAFALAEVIWILSGRNDAEFVNHWNPDYPSYAGRADRYHGAYGHRLRTHFTFDQLDRAYEALHAVPDSRQVVLQIWDPRIDLPLHGRPADEDIPCNICAFLKLRDGRLEWTQVMRSNDFVLGFPHNVVQFTALQEVMAGWLGVKLGSYVHVSDSLHVYENRVSSLADSRPLHLEANTDSLALAKSQSASVLAELERRLHTFASTEVSREHHVELSTIEAPEAYRNILRVTAADDARRRGWWDQAEELMRACTNPVLRQAWRRWADRCGGPNTSSGN